MRFLLSLKRLIPSLIALVFLSAVGCGDDKGGGPGSGGPLTLYSVHPSSGRPGDTVTVCASGATDALFSFDEIVSPILSINVAVAGESVFFAVCSEGDQEILVEVPQGLLEGEVEVRASSGVDQSSSLPFQVTGNDATPPDPNPGETPDTTPPDPNLGDVAPPTNCLGVGGCGPDEACRQDESEIGHCVLRRCDLHEGDNPLAPLELLSPGDEFICNRAGKWVLPGGCQAPIEFRVLEDETSSELNFWTGPGDYDAEGNSTHPNIPFVFGMQVKGARMHSVAICGTFKATEIPDVGLTITNDYKQQNESNSPQARRQLTIDGNFYAVNPEAESFAEPGYLPSFDNYFDNAENIRCWRLDLDDENPNEVQALNVVGKFLDFDHKYVAMVSCDADTDPAIFSRGETNYAEDPDDRNAEEVQPQTPRITKCEGTPNQSSPYLEIHLEGENLTSAAVRVKHTGRNWLARAIPVELDGTFSDQNRVAYIPIIGSFEYECIGYGAFGTSPSTKSYEFTIKPLSQAQISLNASATEDSLPLCNQAIHYNDNQSPSTTTPSSSGGDPVTNYLNEPCHVNLTARVSVPVEVRATGSTSGGEGSFMTPFGAKKITLSRWKFPGEVGDNCGGSIGSNFAEEFFDEDAEGNGIKNRAEFNEGISSTMMDIALDFLAEPLTWESKRFDGFPITMRGYQYPTPVVRQDIPGREDLSGIVGQFPEWQDLEGLLSSGGAQKRSPGTKKPGDKKPPAAKKPPKVIPGSSEYDREFFKTVQHDRLRNTCNRIALVVESYTSSSPTIKFLDLRYKSHLDFAEKDVIELASTQIGAEEKEYIFPNPDKEEDGGKAIIKIPYAAHHLKAAPQCQIAVVVNPRVDNWVDHLDLRSPRSEDFEAAGCSPDTSEEMCGGQDQSQAYNWWDNTRDGIPGWLAFWATSLTSPPTNFRDRTYNGRSLCSNDFFRANISWQDNFEHSCSRMHESWNGYFYAKTGSTHWITMGGVGSIDEAKRFDVSSYASQGNAEPNASNAAGMAVFMSTEPYVEIKTRFRDIRVKCSATGIDGVKYNWRLCNEDGSDCGIKATNQNREVEGELSITRDFIPPYLPMLQQVPAGF